MRAILKDGSTQYKIGVSKHPKKRLLQNKTANPNDLELLYTYHSEFPYLVETSLKNNFKSKKIDGEWFDLSEEDVINFLVTCHKINENYKTIRSNSTLYG